MNYVWYNELNLVVLVQFLKGLRKVVELGYWGYRWVWRTWNLASYGHQKWYFDLSERQKAISTIPWFNAPNAFKWLNLG